jgi:adenylate cyclase
MKKRIPILLGLILVCIAIWLLVTSNKSISSFIERLDNIGYEIQLHAHVLTHKIKPTSPVAIIDIDEKSLKAEGHWPWSRAKLAELTNQLQAQGAAVIAFDIVFPEKENNIAETVLQELSKRNLLNASTSLALDKNKMLFDGDIILAKALATSPTVLAIGFTPQLETRNSLPAPALVLSKELQEQLDIISENGYISSIPVLQNAAKNGGFINIFHDNDGIIRRAPLLIEYKGGVYPALSLQAVMLFLGEPISLNIQKYDRERELEGIQLGPRLIPTDAKGQALIPFIGRSYTFNYYSATDALHNKLSKDALFGKILFVGTSALGLGDLQPTAIQSPYPGVEIQATLVNGILENDFSYIPAWTTGANVFLTFILGTLSAFLFPYFGPRILGVIIVFLPTLLLLINGWIWEKTGLVLSFLIPVILVIVLAFLNIIYGYLFESRRREHLKKMFGQYVPAKHIDEMLKTASDYALQGEDRNMSVLFADIRDFTSISEGLSAAELVELLNTYLNPMTEIIFKHHGTIDKYVGDLIMAFWGAPLKDKNHERHALECALEMQQKLSELKVVLTQHNWPEIKIGIGLNSGIMSVGDMGSRYRRNYTVLGDAVNLASRVESLTKFYGVKIIATEDTVKNQNKFVFRTLDKVKVKGKTQGIAIYEVLCTQAQLTTELKQDLEKYHQALDFYFQQKWDEAFILMSELAQAYPEKKIYPIYLDRINHFKIETPAPNWDGVFVHITK